jgi:hypothetical protein
MKKAISLLSAVIFVGFTISVIALVYNTGMPIVKRMQTTAAIERMKTDFIRLNEIVQTVASEGNGSTRSIYFRSDPGELIVDPVNDIISWYVELTVPIISPRTSQSFGDFVMGSNMETNASLGDYSGTPAFVLENEHLRVYVKKIGSESSYEAYNTTDLVMGVYQKDLSQWMDIDSVQILVDDNDDSASGSGYTFLKETGNYLPYATVSAWMDSAYADYFINITLESGADFVIIRGG